MLVKAGQGIIGQWYVWDDVQLICVRKDKKSKLVFFETEDRTVMTFRYNDELVRLVGCTGWYQPRMFVR